MYAAEIDNSSIFEKKKTSAYGLSVCLHGRRDNASALQCSLRDINIDSLRSFGQYPVLYISLYNCVNFSIGPSYNAFSISAAIKSVPVALLFFNFLMARFTSVDVIEGPLINVWSCYSVISI